jgi:hypothetical protein
MPSRRKAFLRHEWTDEDRVLLCLLPRFYSNDKSSELFRIWNKVNQRRLASEGYAADGLSTTSLHAMFHHLGKKKNETRHPMYARIMDSDLAILRSRYALQKSKIEDCAQALNIVLRLRVDPPRRNSPVEGLGRQTWSSLTTADDSKNDSDDELVVMQNMATTTISITRPPIQSFMYHRAQEPRTQEPLGQSLVLSSRGNDSQNLRSVHQTLGTTAHTELVTAVANNSTPTGPRHSIFQHVLIPTSRPQLGIPSTSREAAFTTYYTPSPSVEPCESERGSPNMLSSHYHDADGGQAMKHYKLLFRAEDPSLNLVARRFQHADITPVPYYRSTEFRRDVQRHLHIDQTFLSPFISLTDSLKDALNRVARAKTKKYVCIFAFNDLMDERYGDDTKPIATRMKPRLVKTIVEDLQFKGDEALPNGYTGVGEVRYGLFLRAIYRSLTD